MLTNLHDIVLTTGLSMTVLNSILKVYLESKATDKEKLTAILVVDYVNDKIISK